MIVSDKKAYIKEFGIKPKVAIKERDGARKFYIVDPPITVEDHDKAKQVDAKYAIWTDKELQLQPTYYKPKVKFEKDSDSLRDILMVVGPSGAGKTTFCNNFALEYHKMYPKNKIIVMTPNPPNDDSIFVKKVQPIIFDLSKPDIISYNFYGSKPLEMADFADSLIIFDDLEGLSAKDARKIQACLVDPILTTGRHYRISILNCRHVATGGHKTQTSHLETNYLVVFPRHEKIERLKYCLKRYGGLDEREMDFIKSQNSRYCVIHNRAPHFFLGQQYIKI